MLRISTGGLHLDECLTRFTPSCSRRWLSVERGIPRRNGYPAAERDSPHKDLVAVGS